MSLMALTAPLALSTRASRMQDALGSVVELSLK